MADSLDPRDVAEQNKLLGELRGLVAEQQRALGDSQRLAEDTKTNQRQSAEDRKASKQETKVRRSQVGKGGTPVGEQPVVDTTPQESARVRSEARQRLIDTRDQERAVRRLREEEERLRRLPVHVGTQLGGRSNPLDTRRERQAQEMAAHDAALGRTLPQDVLMQRGIVAQAQAAMQRRQDEGAPTKTAQKQTDGMVRRLQVMERALEIQLNAQRAGTEGIVQAQRSYANQIALAGQRIRASAQALAEAQARAAARSSALVTRPNLPTSTGYRRLPPNSGYPGFGGFGEGPPQLGAGPPPARQPLLLNPGRGDYHNVPRDRGATPPPPPRNTTLGDEMDKVRTAEQKAADARAASIRAARAAGTAEDDFQSTLQRSTRALGLADNAYRKHGYLTSEFIEAAGRGQVTFAELGAQVTGTIAKFAGWTAAATAVYGALGAVAALGRGAIQSASGLALLERVADPSQLPGGADQLQQSFRDNARKYNLPTADVVQATYGAAKAFGGDLPSALKATESALFAVKVGELSAADSTNYLNAIVKGFGLTANELPAVFDSINQAQNRFGGNTGALVGGMAKAAGIFKLAGGNYKELTALLTVGSKLTGASATEVGTALSRASSTVLTPQGAKRLAAVGLDATQGFPQILAEASKKAQTADPETINALARALVPAGGQYARILAPIIENRDLYNKVLEEVTKNSAGSANRELSKALAAPNEQLKLVITNVEAIGGALAQSGALGGLGAFLRITNTLLGTTNSLLNVFTNLTSIIPAPFRNATGAALELIAVMKLARRFDLGGSLPTARNPNGAYGRTRESLRRDPEALQNAQILTGTRDEAKFVEEERKTAARQAARYAAQTEQAHTRLVEAGTTLRNGPQSGEVFAANEQAAIAAEEDLASAKKIEARLVQDQEAWVARSATLQKQIVDFEAAKARGLTAEAAALESGIFYAPGTLSRPNASDPVRLGQNGAPLPPLAGGLRGAPQQGSQGQHYSEPKSTYVPPGSTQGRTFYAPPIGGAGEIDTKLQATRLKQARDNLARNASRQAATLASAFTLSGPGRAFDRLTAGSKTGAAAMAVGNRSLALAGGALAGLSSQGRRFGGSIGRFATTAMSGLDGILIAAIAIPQVYSHFRDKENELNAASARLASAALSSTNFEEIQQQAANAALKGPSALEGIGNFTTRVVNFLPGVDRVTEQQKRQREAAQAYATSRALEAAQAKGVELFQPQITTRLARNRAVATNPAEDMAALQTALKEQAVSFANLGNNIADPKAAKQARVVAAANVEKIKGQIADLRVAQGDLGEAAKQLTSLDAVTSFSNTVGNQIADRGVTPRSRQATTLAIIQATKLRAIDPKKDEDGKILAQINQSRSQILDAASTHLNNLLAVAKTPEARSSARNEYLQSAQAAYPVSAERQEIARLQGNLNANQAKLPVAQAVSKLTFGSGGGKVQRIKQAIADEKKAIEVMTGRVATDQEALNAIVAEQKQADFQEAQGLFDARTQLIAGRTANPVTALKGTLDRQRSRLGAIADQFGKNSQEYITALDAARQAQDNLLAEKVTRATAQGELKAAGETDPVAAVRDQLEATNRALALLADAGKQQTDQYIQLLTQKKQQQQQLVQQRISSFQSDQEVSRSAANIGASDESKLQGAVSDASSSLQFVQSQKGATKDQINGAIVAYNNARGALADFLKQNASDLRDAQLAFALSKTEDPVKQARLQLDAARAALAQADTPAAKLNARADINNKQRDLRNQIQQKSVDQINLDADLGRIDKETQIARLQGVLKTMKGNLDLRHSIQRQIYALQHANDSTFDLNLGNIKLPTVYEVRRAVSSALPGQQGHTLQDNSNTKVEINVNGPQDYPAMGQELEKHINGAGRAMARVAGLR